MTAGKLQKFFDAHAEVTKTLRQALSASDESQRDMLRSTFETTAARTENTRLLVMTVAEAHAILKLALPPSTRTIPLRIEHAMLMIHMARMLDELALIGTDTVPYTAIAAGQHLAVAVRDWLMINNQVVMGADDSLMTNTAGRPRTPDAQNRVPKRRKGPKMLPLGFPPSWHNDQYNTPDTGRPRFVPCGEPQNDQRQSDPPAAPKPCPKPSRPRKVRQGAR